MGRPRVLIGDDHLMFSEGLRRILDPHFEIVGIIGNGRELIDAVERLRPDVLIADISMPLLNGIEAARRIRKMPQAPKIVFLTMHEDATFATAAFQAGAASAKWDKADGFYIILTDQPGGTTWPISGATFILIHKQPKDQ